jgi:hypothetical protein
MYEQDGICRYSLGSFTSLHLTIAAWQKLPVQLQLKGFPSLNLGKWLDYLWRLGMV